MKNPTIAITGANGFIGKALVKYFSEKNWHVHALQRKPISNPTKNVTFHSFSLPNHFVKKSLEGVDVLIHCAVQHYTPTNKHADANNEAGAEKLIKLCSETGTKIIFLSTLSAHEQAKSHYGKNKLKLESLFDPKKDLVLKLGLVVGDTGGLFHTIYESIKKTNVIPLVDGGNQPMQTIAIDDLCQIIESGINNNIIGNYKIAEHKAFPMKELYSVIAHQLGKEPKFIPVPSFILMTACKIAEIIGIKLPVSSESVLGLKQLRNFDTSNDLKKFGIKAKSFKETVKSLKAEN